MLSQPHPPLDELVRHTIARIMNLPIEHITNDTRLPAMGVDSLHLTEFAMFFEKLWQVQIDSEGLVGFKTVREVVTYLTALRATTLQAANKETSL